LDRVMSKLSDLVEAEAEEEAVEEVVGEVE
jgi:hypothetical protein